MTIDNVAASLFPMEDGLAANNAAHPQWHLDKAFPTQKL
jgi:hypothetical protein